MLGRSSPLLMLDLDKYDFPEGAFAQRHYEFEVIRGDLPAGFMFLVFRVKRDGE